MEAQKAELGKKQNALSVTLGKVRDLKTAEQLEYARRLDMAAMHIRVKAKELSGPVENAAANEAAAALEADATMRRDALETNEFQRAFSLADLKLKKADFDMRRNAMFAEAQRGAVFDSGQPLPPDLYFKLDPKMQDRYFHGTDGYYHRANSEEDVKKIKDIQEGIIPLQKALKEYGGMDEGTWKRSWDRSKVIQAREGLISGLKYLRDQKQMTEGEYESNARQVPDLSDWFQFETKDKLSYLATQIQDKMNAMYKVRGTGSAAVEQKEIKTIRR
jgi:hypothetical protein